MKKLFFTVYARKEPTTEKETLKHFKNKNRFDVQIYRDKKAKVPFGRWAWYLKDKPTKRNKEVVINCFSWQLEWI